ncbi:SPW repeat protein [Herbaspirillum sp. NPDC101396]|uniref:SPW repeat protein n=1 Tax=Herbaspirillum sp. NPDC101396 TaxID=3364005 RepID=UPI00383A490B
MNTFADTDTDSRWQACVMATVGIALLASPWLMEYTQQPISRNAMATGSAITVFALLAIVVPALWEDAVLLMLGCWTVASPWILGFEDQRGASLICVAAGGIVLISALWAMKNEDRIGASAGENMTER